jgi:hypothetical protein
MMRGIYEYMMVYSVDTILVLRLFLTLWPFCALAALDLQNLLPSRCPPVHFGDLVSDRRGEVVVVRWMIKSSMQKNQKPMSPRILFHV